MVIDGDGQQGRQFCARLQYLDYSISLLHSLQALEEFLKQSSDIAVILDLDTVAVEGQSVRALKKRYPHLPMLGVSKLLFHPGLEELIGSHLYACLVKPLDMEELSFWLKSIAADLDNKVKVTADSREDFALGPKGRGRDR